MDSLQNIFKDLDEAFDKSDIKKSAKEKGVVWNYSLLASPANQYSLLGVGFNWGAAKDCKYEKQTIDNIPIKFPEDMGSLIRIKYYIDKYFPSIPFNEVVQTNYCFFRSQKEAEITPNDIQLCQPIFQKLLSYLQPKAIISFSSKFRDALIKDSFKDNDFYLDEKTCVPIITNMGEYNLVTGTLHENTLSSKIYFLPNPMYRLKKEFRDECWKIAINSEN